MIVPLKVKVGSFAVQGLTAWVTGLTLAAAVTAATLHVTLYFAAPEAVETGSVTTRTAEPLPACPAGVIASGATAIVPALVKVMLAGAESSPLDSTQ